MYFVPFSVVKIRSAGCALARRRNMSQVTALGARMRQGMFIFILEFFQRNFVL